MSSIFLSVIIPFYNEHNNLVQLHNELLMVVKKIKKRVEIIYIDDCSTDSSLETLLVTLKQTESAIPIRVIAFKRNFGQTAAMVAGIEAAKGKYLTFLDSDLQNDPRDIFKLLTYTNKGYDAVFGWRKDRKDSFFRTFFSNAGNWVIRKYFNVPLHDSGCTLKICNKDLFENSHFYGEAHRIMSVMLFTNSNKSKEVVVNHRARTHGSSKYNYFRIFKLIIDLMTAKFLNEYNTKPAYVFGFPGVIINLLGFSLILVVFLKNLFYSHPIYPDPLFLVAIFFIIIGIQFIFIGLLAEIQIRIYFETQNKKTYQVRKIITI